MLESVTGQFCLNDVLNILSLWIRSGQQAISVF